MENNNNNSKKQYNSAMEAMTLLDMGEQSNSAERVRTLRGDKIHAWDPKKDNWDDAYGYQALKRNEIRKGAADDFLKGCRSYYGQLTSDDVPKAKYNFDKVDPDTNEDTQKALDTEMHIYPKGVKDTYPYNNVKEEDFNDDANWKVKDDPVPSGSVVDLDADDKKGEK